MRRLVLTLVLFLTVNSGVPAQIAFDFEGVTATYTDPPGGARPGALTSLTVSNSALILTLSRFGNTPFDVVANTGNQGGKPPTWGNRSLDPFANPGTSGWIGNLSTTATGVLVEFGDYGEDSDTITLRLFDGPNGTGNELGSATNTNYGSNGFPMLGVVFVSGLSNVRSFTLEGTSTASGFENSVFLDNILVAGAAVPEPAGLGLGVVGLLGVGWFARRRLGRIRRRATPRRR